MNKKLFIIIPVAILLIILLVVFFLNKGASVFPERSSSGASLSGLLNQAKDLEAKNNLSEEKAVYQKLIMEFSNSSEVTSWDRKIEELNLKLLFSNTITPGSVIYEIKPGDTLNKIASNFKTTTDLIKKSNNLNSDNIVPGRKIKVWNSAFTILVDKSQNILILKSNEDVVKTYVVSTGLNNSTPIGTFKIANKLTNPTWFKAGAVVPPGAAENALGSRWMGFDLPGYGIHGTTDPQSLGKQVTQGCVRLSNADVEELYQIVPAGTEVTIVD